jgi:hypothetical protein
MAGTKPGHDEMPDAFSVIRLGMAEGSSLAQARDGRRRLVALLVEIG